MNEIYAKTKTYLINEIAEDARERSLTKPNVLSVGCPACGMSNSIAWGSMDLPPFRQAVAMLADSWNSR